MLSLYPLLWTVPVFPAVSDHRSSSDSAAEMPVPAAVLHTLLLLLPAGVLLPLLLLPVPLLLPDTVQPYMLHTVLHLQNLLR